MKKSPNTLRLAWILLFLGIAIAIGAAVLIYTTGLASGTIAILIGAISVSVVCKVAYLVSLYMRKSK